VLLKRTRVGKMLKSSKRFHTKYVKDETTQQLAKLYKKSKAEIHAHVVEKLRACIANNFLCSGNIYKSFT